MTSLRDRVEHWTRQGYRVVSETSSSAQLVKPKRFNPAEFLVMPIYLFEYLGQRELQVYLSLQSDGTVTETGSALERSAYRRGQERSTAWRLGVVLMWSVVIVVVLYALNQIGVFG